MAVGERGDLRQVRDADDLAAGRELAQLLADRPGGLAADAGVDLVEDQRRPGRPRAATPISASITRESSPPDAVSRSGPAGTPGLGAIRNSTSSAPVAAKPPSRGVSETANSAPSIASAASRSRTACASSAPAASRAALSAAASSPSSARAAARSRSAPLDRLLRARELVTARAAGLGVLEHGRDRAAVLALEAIEQREALLDLFEATRSRLDALGVAVQVVHQVLGLDAPAPARGRPARPAPRRPRRRPRAPARPRRARARRRRRPRRRRPAPPTPPATARCSASTWRSRPRSASSASSSCSLGAAPSISASSHASRSSSRSRAPARSRSVASRCASARSRA